MLLELSVRNVALIESARLAFYPGLSVLTGETGAGKSILIDALGLVLGGRADRTLVRAGSEKASVEALFDLTGAPAALALLGEWGIDVSEGTAVIVRELTSSGRSVCRVSGALVTASQLKTLCGILVDLHGQHEHQRLLDRLSHRAWVDAFAGSALREERAHCAEAYRAWSATRGEIDAMGGAPGERARRADMLRFQTEEIISAHLEDGEWDDLSARRNRLRHAERIAEHVRIAWVSLWEGEDGSPSVRDLAAEALTALQAVADLDPSLASSAQKIDEVRFVLEEASESLRPLLSFAESDPNELEHIEDRIALINQLRRKYGASGADPVDGILAFLAQARSELEALEDSGETLARLASREALERAALEASCSALTQLRRVAGSHMADRIAEVLRELGMEKARVSIDIRPAKDAAASEQPGDPESEKQTHLTPEGWDAVEILIAPNPGEPMKPLADIASGGEISRVMLALKSIGAQQGDVGTLIFDEIDTGVSGRVAQAVAEKMADIAETRQVLCVTHLPQIAAMGAHHYRVEKAETAGRTQTHVMLLDHSGRVEEIARLVGGSDTVSETAMRHAQSVLEAGAAYRHKKA